MLADTVGAAVDALLAESGLPYERAGYDAALLHVRAGLHAEVERAVGLLAEVLEAAWEVRALLEPLSGKALVALTSDVRAQVDALVPDGFVTAHGVRRLPDLLRYLRAAQVRLRKAPTTWRATPSRPPRSPRSGRRWTAPGPRTRARSPRT